MTSMTPAAPFGPRLRALREAAGFTQEELATIAGLSVHAVSALERGHRRRPQAETVRMLSAALGLNDSARDALLAVARPPSAIAGQGFDATTLPLAPTPLIGREDDVRVLREWWAESGARLITLVGPGGAGKTRLALEIAHAVADAGNSRVVFVPLASIRTPALVAGEIADA